MRNQAPRKRSRPSNSDHRADQTARILLRSTRLRPRLAIVLGSGFQCAVDRIEIERTVPYEHLPGFLPCRVAGHAGRLIVGQLNGTAVFVLCGRIHYYEGHSLQDITFPIRVLAAAGIQSLLLTNAAGGIHPKLRSGDFMRLDDHINLMGANPLRGTVATTANSFLDLSQTYDPFLGTLLARAARRCRIPLRRGVYLAVSGPSYETPAEIRAFAQIGADAVGMSTVPEAIVAKQCGLSVAGLSCITNVAAGRNPRPITHQEVLDTGLRMAESSSEFVAMFARLYREACQRAPNGMDEKIRPKH